MERKHNLDYDLHVKFTIQNRTFQEQKMYVYYQQNDTLFISLASPLIHDLRGQSLSKVAVLPRSCSPNFLR